MSKQRVSRYKALPSALPRHAFANGRISLVVPEASENLISNPPIEQRYAESVLGTRFEPLGMSNISYNRNISRRNYGSYCIGPSNDASAGIYVDQNIPYGYNSFSVDLLGGKNATFEIGFLAASGEVKKSKVVTARGFWQRESVTYHAPQDESCLLFVRKTSPRITQCNWYVDGWQHELSDHATTFFEGYSGAGWCGRQCFRDGSAPYQWAGEAYNSSSMRHNLTHSGGRILNLSDTGFVVTGLSGFGAPPVENIEQKYATVDGSFWQGQCYSGVDLTISGMFHPCETGGEVHKARQKLVEAVTQISQNYREPMIIRYQQTNCCEKTVGREMQACALYSGGLEMLLNACNMESDVDISFRMPSPYWTEDGVQIATYDVTSADSDTEFCMEVCNRGTAPAPLIFQASGPYSITSMRSLETGDRIDFAEPYQIPFPNIVNISTDPTNTFAVDASANVDITGRIAAGSSLSSFELLPNRVNTICVTLSNVTDPTPNPLNPARPYFRVTSVPRFYGVDAANCLGDCEDIPC